MPLCQVFANWVTYFKELSQKFQPIMCTRLLYFQYHVVPVEQGIELSKDLLTNANTSASHNSVVIISNKFHSLKTFLLSKHSFGFAKNKKVRVLILQAITHCKNSCLAMQDCKTSSIRPEWHEKYGWLHYDVLH